MSIEKFANKKFRELNKNRVINVHINHDRLTQFESKNKELHIHINRGVVVNEYGKERGKISLHINDGLVIIRKECDEMHEIESLWDICDYNVYCSINRGVILFVPMDYNLESMNVHSILKSINHNSEDNNNDKDLQEVSSGINNDNDNGKDTIRKFYQKLKQHPAITKDDNELNIYEITLVGIFVVLIILIVIAIF